MVAVLDPPRLRRKATRFFETNDLPEGFEWVERLSRLHYRLFVVDLHRALADALIHKENGERLREVLEDWEATAEVDSDRELVAKLRKPRSEKRYREWKPTGD